MGNWIKTITIKEFLTEEDDYDSIQNSMNKIADVLCSHFEFGIVIEKMRNIPKGDNYFKPVDYANKLLNKFYDIADYEGIWIN